MPSAYELMLVLRGRNYLSNDLRRVGSDLRGLQAQRQLQNQRKQLQINAERLATTRSIAQNEIGSLQRGSRRLQLDQRIQALGDKQLAIVEKLNTANDELVASERAQVANAEKLATLQAEMSRRQDIGSGGYARLREQVVQLNAANETLIAQQRELTASVLAYEDALTKLGVKEQELVAIETERAHRLAILSSQVNTATAADTLNTKKLDENARMMKTVRIQAFGAAIQHLGRTLQTFGFLATAAFGVAANAAAKFTTGGVLAATQMITRSSNSVKQILNTGSYVSKQLLAFQSSGRSVLSNADINQAAYDIPSGIPSLRGDSVQKAKQTIAIIKELNTVSKANFGLVDLNGLTDAAIVLVNTFGTSISKLPHEFDIMQSAVNRGKITMGDFVNGLAKTGPAAASAGYSFDQMASTLSFLSDKISNYSVVISGYARSIDIFNNLKFRDYMRQHGEAITDANGKLLSYEEVIKRILKVAPSLATTHGNLVAFLKEASGATGTIQARRTLTVSLRDQAGLEEASRAVPANARGLVNAQATALSQTGAVKWKQLTTELKALAIVIGQQAIPAFVTFAKPLEGALKWFNQLSPQTQHMIGYFGAMSAILVTITGTFLIFVGAVARGYGIIKDFVIGKGGLAAAEDGFLSSGTALRVGLIGAVLLAIPLLIRYHSQIGNVIQKLGGLKDVLLILSAAFAAFRLTGAIAMFTAATAAANVFRLMMLRVAAIGIITVGIELVVHRAAAAKALDDFFSHIPGYNKSAAHDFFSGIAGTDAASVAKAASNASFQTNADRIFGTPGHKQTRASLDNQDIYGVGPAKNLPLPKMDNTIKVLKQARQVAGLVSEHGNNLITYVSKNQFKSSNTGGNGGIGGSAFNVQDAIANVEKLRAAASKAPTIANYTAYEKALTALQKHFKGDQLTALNDYLNNIESTEKKSNSKRLSEEKKAENARKKAVKAAQAEILKDAQALQNSYQQFYSTNQSAFGTLFNGPHVNSPMVQNRLQYGAKLTGKDLLADIRSQVHAFRQWRGLLAQLRRRGITGDLYDQIVQAGPGSIDDVRALLSLSKTDLRTYAKTFASGENLIAQATQQDMNLSLVRYRQYGRNIALQIIEGMRDEHTPATKVFEDMIKKQFPGLANKAGKGSSTPTSTVKPNGPGGSVVIAQHDHYHVNAPRTEHSSIQTQLRHATFASRTKRLKKPLK